MLSAFFMKLRILGSHHVQAMKNSFLLLVNKPMATLMTMVVIAMTLALPLLFGVVTENLQQLASNWQENGRISLYLAVPLSEADTTSLVTRVRETKGVGLVSLRSAADGLAELQQQEGMQDIMQYLPENPLPAVIDVLPETGMNEPMQLEALFETLKAYPHVEQAKLDLQWINRLYSILNFVVKLAHSLMILLALAVILIIANTLRLAIHNRQEEIQVLKLIGASDSFIVRPFLYSGMFYGLVGALLAVVCVNLFILSLRLVIVQLTAAYQMQFTLLGISLQQAVFLAFFAMLLGWLAARFSVKRQLASIDVG